MKIATFNINNVNRRLPNLLDWLKTAKPDIVCPQELKCTDAQFPVDAIKQAGYHAVWRGQRTWNGVAILSRGSAPIVTRTSLPGDPSDDQSRYIEAAIEGILVGCIYLPNGNPQPGPKFDYKLAWFKRLTTHARKLLREDRPVVLAGDYNVAPPRSTSIPRRPGMMTPWCSRRAGRRTRSWSPGAGPMPSAHCIPTSASTLSGTICAIAGSATRAFALIICCSAPQSPRG
jgi:exodeoxyribonuclease-3